MDPHKTVALHLSVDLWRVMAKNKTTLTNAGYSTLEWQRDSDRVEIGVAGLGTTSQPHVMDPFI